MAQRAPDLGGTWIGKTEVPGVGLTEITLVLKKVDKGYGGTIASGNQAVISGSPEIKDVTADGEKLEFVFPLADGTLLLMKLAVAGGRMTGRWEHPSGSTGAVELARKK
ncbi:MAG: hypothetical protein HGA24_00850 [Candidatus Aminicenantes bacterium]|nr:hypothetical protein [Candidatus Aminicenantes bacterium]